MRQSVIELEKFYASRLGQAARDMAARRLSSVWPALPGREILGFGYCQPYLRPYLDSAKRVVLAMPDGQGAMAQSGKRGLMTCLVQEDALPFSDAQFDNVLVAHGVEETNLLPVLLAELWRITRPEGRIVVIASNRAGLWARSDKSPFGSGRPFSRGQLRSVLKTAGFIPTIWSGALYSPPVRLLTGSGSLGACEKFGETVFPGFSGLVLVEAVKRLYVDSSGGQTDRVTRPVFGAAPIGNTATRTK